MLYYARCHVLSANTLGKWFSKVLPGSCVIKSTQNATENHAEYFSNSFSTFVGHMDTFHFCFFKYHYEFWIRCSQYFHLPSLSKLIRHWIIYNNAVLVIIISSFYIKDKFIANVRCYCAIFVESPFLPRLSMFCPQGYFRSRHIPTSNHIQACMIYLGFK